MKILMLAPEPFFQARGTAFSVLHRLQALSGFGHQIDLVTYPLGEDREFPGVRIYRLPRLPFLHAIKIGPSLAKIPLDFLMFWRAFFLLATRHYDLIHSHEEAGFLALLLTRVFRVKHLYDMHSSLPQQLFNFDFSRSRFLHWLFRVLERSTLRNADAVITICPELDRLVDQISPGTWHIVIENVMDDDTAARPPAVREELIRELELPEKLADKKIILYAGTFEPYQGLDLLLDAAAAVKRRRSDAVFLLVGGKPEQIAALQTRAAALALGDAVHFAGWRKPEEIPLFMSLSDVLASPRTKGVNTPLKIYSYLRSGKPIVATRTLTHTQVLNDSVAILAQPDAIEFADGLMRALDEPDLCSRLTDAAQRLAAEQYSYESYSEKMRSVCVRLRPNGERAA